MLTHDHRISWTWDATLEAYPAGLRELYGAYPNGIKEEGGSTIDQAISAESTGSIDIDWGDFGPVGGESATPIKDEIDKPTGLFGGTV